jgi:hypothetical protein
MTNEAYFTARERFDPADGERWRSYFEWAKIPALREVVSLDTMLCPCVIDEMTDQDWAHAGGANFMFGYFRDLDYLIGRIPRGKRRNILGVYRNPTSHIGHMEAGDHRLAFFGYDLIEDQTSISALSNCGGFPKVFSNDELNEFGLLSGFSRALEIQRHLRTEYPDDPHAECELYAIWRLDEGNSNGRV